MAAILSRPQCVKKWLCHSGHRVALVVHRAQKSVPGSAGEWPTFLPPPLESCSGTANVDGPNWQRKSETCLSTTKVVVGLCAVLPFRGRPLLTGPWLLNSIPHLRHSLQGTRQNWTDLSHHAQLSMCTSRDKMAASGMEFSVLIECEFVAVVSWKVGWWCFFHTKFALVRSDDWWVSFTRPWAVFTRLGRPDEWLVRTLILLHVFISPHMCDSYKATYVNICFWWAAWIAAMTLSSFAWVTWPDGEINTNMIKSILHSRFCNDPQGRIWTTCVMGNVEKW